MLDPYPAAFTFLNTRDTGALACVPMLFFIPAQVVQALYDVLPSGDAKANRDIMDASLPPVGVSTFHDEAHAPEKSSRRTVMFV